MFSCPFIVKTILTSILFVSQMLVLIPKLQLPSHKHIHAFICLIGASCCTLECHITYMMADSVHLHHDVNWVNSILHTVTILCMSTSSVTVAQSIKNIHSSAGKLKDVDLGRELYLFIYPFILRSHEE